MEAAFDDTDLDDLDETATTEPTMTQQKTTQPTKPPTSEDARSLDPAGDAAAPRAKVVDAEAVSELALISPVRSMAAISLSFLLFTQVLSRVGATTLAVLLPSAFPAQPDEETLVVPGTVGLVAMLAMTLFNATLAGLLAGRIGRAMRLWHGVVLGAVLAMFAAISMEALRDFPGWFALGYLVSPVLGASLGGWLAARVRPAQRGRLVAESVSRQGDERDES